MYKIQLTPTNQWMVLDEDNNPTYLEPNKVVLKMWDCTLKNEAKNPWVEAKRIEIKKQRQLEVSFDLVSFDGDNWLLDDKIVDDEGFEALVTIEHELFLQ